MRQAIAEAYQVDELKQIRDQALLLVAKGIENERKACEIRLRSERRAGELLRKMEKAKGSAVDRSHDATSPQTLADLGLTKSQSSQWQKLADIPKERFEEELAQAEILSKACRYRKAKAFMSWLPQCSPAQ